MTLTVALCFALGTGIELYLLKWLSTHISIVNTLSLVMFTFLIGIVVSRSWGNDCFEKLQWHLKSRSVPPDDALNGTALALASIMLITPGIVTDIVGFLIFIPPIRDIFKDLTLDFVKKKIARGEVYFFFRD